MIFVRTARKAFSLIGATRRRRFFGVAWLGFVVSLFEAGSAIVLLILLRLIINPEEVFDSPLMDLVGDIFPNQTQDATVVTYLSVAFAAFFLARAIVFLVQRYTLAKVVEDNGVLLAERLVTGYLAMPYEFHLTRNSAESVRNAHDNVGQVVNGVFEPLADLIAETVLVIVMVVVLLIVSPTATLIAILIVGVTLAVTLVFIQPPLRRLGRERQAAAKSALQHLQQGLGGLRDIKILGRESEFTLSFRQARETMAASQYLRSTLSYVPRVTLETVFLLVLLGALVIATNRGTADSAISTLGLFAYAGLRLQPSLQKIASALNSLRYAESVVDDLRSDLELLDATQAEHDAMDTVRGMLSFYREIKFDGVSFRYGGASAAAITNLDLTILRGETIGVAGPTGGGKTTLIDLLCGLLRPTEGAILVDGTDIATDTRAWQQNLGVVHQTSFLIDDTLRRNIALGVSDPEINEDALSRAVRIAQLDEVIARLPDGLNTVVGERGVRLSGGQRQRVTLARALYRRPSVLVLDEGTSALDHATEAAVMDGLQEVHGETTLIMVAHRLTTIETCDRIIYVDSGRITAIGTFEELRRTVPSFRTMAS